MTNTTKIIPLETSDAYDDMLFARLCDSPIHNARIQERRMQEQRTRRYNDFLEKAIIATASCLATLIFILFII